MLVLVINLDRRPDRMAAMARQLEGLGLEYERVQAVDARDLAGDPREGIRVPSNPYPFTLPEIACYQSHRRCWEILVDSGASNALILEDDVILSQRTAQVLRDARFHPPSDGVLRAEAAVLHALLAWRPRVAANGFAVHGYASTQWHAAAYVLGDDAARLLLARAFEPKDVVDAVLMHPPPIGVDGLRRFQLAPAIAVQGNAHHARGLPAMYESDLEEARAEARAVVDPEGLLERVRRPKATSTVERVGREVSRAAVNLRRGASSAWYVVSSGHAWRKPEFAGDALET
ncbi:MAG: glycosyltransferase family 25 protein [Planctomycetota bacterium]|nr:glycosyltransferase family 25 protein [Planctomycetota bacterium]